MEPRFRPFAPPALVSTATLPKRTKTPRHVARLVDLRKGTSASGNDDASRGEPRERELKRADFAQLNVRVSPSGWEKLAVIQAHYGHMSASQMIEMLIAERYDALPAPVPSRAPLEYAPADLEEDDLPDPTD